MKILIKRLFQKIIFMFVVLSLSQVVNAAPPPSLAVDPGDPVPSCTANNMTYSLTNVRVDPNPANICTAPTDTIDVLFDVNLTGNAATFDLAIGYTLANDPLLVDVECLTTGADNDSPDNDCQDYNPGGMIADGNLSVSCDADDDNQTDAFISADLYLNWEGNGVNNAQISSSKCRKNPAGSIRIPTAPLATITLEKIVDNTAGGAATTADFTLSYVDDGSIYAGSVLGSGVSGDVNVTNVDVPVGTYTLSESFSEANYTQTSLTCTGTTGLSGNTLTLSNGEVAVCTFTNTYTVPPAGPTAPTVVSQTTNDSTPTITGTLDSVDTINVIVNGVTYTEGDGNLTDVGDGTWTLTIPTANAIPDGTYDVNATVTDALTNTASDATTDELIIDTVITTPAVDAQVTNNTTPTITGDANSSDTLTVTVDGVTYTEGDGNLTDNTDDTWTLVIPVALTTDTTYDVTATVTDAATNTSSDVTTGELIIDTSITTPTVTTQTTSDTTPTITGTADSADTLTVEVNGTIYTEGDGNLTDNGNDTWTLTIPVALDTNTTYDVTATVTDAATNTVSDGGTGELILDSTVVVVLPACGNTITLITAEKWYSVSRPCGLVNNPTVAELFNAAPGLGVYGTNWGLWKLDGTNPGYTNSESHTLLASDALVMKSGVGYWMWSDTNVTWDPGAIATLADPTGSSWNVPTVDTNTTVELNITDPDVSAFYVVTPTADLKVGLIRDTQEVLLGNPFNKAITWENVYFSSDNGNTYKRADANTTSGIRHTAWVTNQDHTGSAVYPYEPISTTAGFKHTIEANQAFWIEVNGGWAAHPSERLAIPLEN